MAYREEILKLKDEYITEDVSIKFIDSSVKIKSPMDLLNHIVDYKFRTCNRTVWVSDNPKINMRLQCGNDRNRSLDDVVLLFKYYFPEMSETEVLHFIYHYVKHLNNANKLIYPGNTWDNSESGEPYKIKLMKCPDIGKFVFIRGMHPHSKTINGFIVDYGNGYLDLLKNLDTKLVKYSILDLLKAARDGVTLEIYYYNFDHEINEAYALLDKWSKQIENAVDRPLIFI